MLIRIGGFVFFMILMHKGAAPISQYKHLKDLSFLKIPRDCYLLNPRCFEKSVLHNYVRKVVFTPSEIEPDWQN